MMESRLLIIQCFQGLVNNSILCITEDNKGNLWFGSNGGVSRYDIKVLPIILLLRDWLTM